MFTATKFKERKYVQGEGSLCISLPYTPLSFKKFSVTKMSHGV